MLAASKSSARVATRVNSSHAVPCIHAPGGCAPQPYLPYHAQPSAAPAQPAQLLEPVQHSRRPVTCRAATADAPEELAPVPSTADGKLISKTEVAAFIQRDDMMDQMYRWAIIEAGEGGVRNFGLPMDVTPFYHTVGSDKCLWGYQVGIYKEGDKRCDLGIMFDQEEVAKHEWVGRGDDGFPVLEGKVNQVVGKHLEIWKLCTRPVDEELRGSIRAFCTQLVIAINRYYAFGSVFVDDAQ